MLRKRPRHDWLERIHQTQVEPPRIRYIFFNLIVAELINEYNKVHELQRKEQVNRDLLQRELARDQLRKRRFFRNKDKDKENDNKNKKP